MKKHQGFTLIELLVAITIIAVLTVVGAVSYAPINKRSRDARRKNDIQEVRRALELYRTEVGYYPNANSGAWGLTTTLEASLVPTYAPSLPADPGANAYRYIETGASGGNYYGYCVCGKLETLTTASNGCPGVTLPAECNYSLRNP